MTVEWKEEYGVGLSEVDNQHRRFLEIINNLGECINQKTYKEKGAEIFFSLVHFADQYLLREKMLVNEVKGIDYSFFRQKHQEFLDQLHEFQTLCKENCSEMLYIDLYNYLKRMYPEYLSYYTPSLVKILKASGVR